MAGRDAARLRAVVPGSALRDGTVEIVEADSAYEHGHLFRTRRGSDVQRLTLPDGVTRDGWLRAGDGMDFTADTLTEVAVRLARGEGKPGAYTPAAAFGPELAAAAGDA
ncbi:hypothetical protein ACIPPJ_12065 [Streptomyces sp. NPDC086091]|uniref:hypothetical protein n=1 Tax=Streptomyces sp. NPDC086091 TaxID=3365751 RepID=UPI0038108994